MSSIEKSILKYFNEYFPYYFLGGVTVMSVLIRLYCKDYLSMDMEYCLLPWYDVFKSKGVCSLSNQVGDYNICYQTIIFLFTLIPIKPIYIYKIFSAVFDYGIAIVAALIVDDKPATKLWERIESGRFLTAYTVLVFSPIIFLNSSCWGQCDSIYSFFILFSLLSFLKKRYNLMFVAYGMAFSFKFHAIFVLPFFLIIYFVYEKFPISKFILPPLILEISAIPGLIMGRGILDPFIIYMKQTGTYSAVSMNYNSFWNILVKSWKGVNKDYYEFKMVASFFTVFVLGLILKMLIDNKRVLDTFSTVLLLHITVYTCILFLPTMHERYSYIYEITAIMLMFYDKQYFFPGVGVILLSCITYGHYLFGIEYPVLLTSLLNVFIYCVYMHFFYKNLRNCYKIT